MRPDFKWFLALSVAAHAAVLLAWVAPPVAGSAGQVLLVELTARAGEAAARPAHETPDTHRPAAAARPAVPRKQASAAPPAVPRPAIESDPTAVHPRQAMARAADSVAARRQETVAASSPVPSRAESDRQLRESVLQLVAQRLHYPAIARSRGWQGVVTLELHIESDGVISELQVKRTSGYAALDRAAMEALQLASIPGAGQWLGGRSVDMLVPVEYRLLDS